MGGSGEDPRKVSEWVRETEQLRTKGKEAPLTGADVMKWLKSGPKSRWESISTLEDTEAKAAVDAQLGQGAWDAYAEQRDKPAPIAPDFTDQAVKAAREFERRKSGAGKGRSTFLTGPTGLTDMAPVDTKKLVGS